MANPLKREINIAGRKVPIWAIGAGAIGAIALYIVTVARGGKPPGESLAPQETTGETSQVEQQQASFQKAIEQQQTGVENIASQLTGQYAALQSSFQKSLEQIQQQQAGLSANVSSALAQQQAQFEREIGAIQRQPAPAVEPARAPQQIFEVPYEPPSPQAIALPRPRPRVEEHISGIGGSYIVRSGDTLSRIAQQSGMNLKQLLALNPQFQANPNLIRPGQTVRLQGGVGDAYLTRAEQEIRYRAV